MTTANWLELNTLKVAVDASPLANQAREALNSGNKAKSSMLRIQNIIVLNSELENIYKRMDIAIEPRTSDSDIESDGGE